MPTIWKKLVDYFGLTGGAEENIAHGEIPLWHQVGQHTRTRHRIAWLVVAASIFTLQLTTHFIDDSLLGALTVAALVYGGGILLSERWNVRV
ncbi:hypothetical protein SAMN05421595_0900 [Austwickia chelonae]|uniref:Uncharacterized protein n=1 Tax=Austwickia chelonae NBRC 105200 TaxID=1184607 RepID=K6V830_9MICO|nr:hypothetical protein [Austwickia chelonae]GAB78383.1 hypothetical protein AUCHE_08_06310 [Austwickia chelonae NBRC 105200]SEW02493.1 hypothetical protein SAMN05421595_0900 [Austwickia chelonae]